MNKPTGLLLNDNDIKEQLSYAYIHAVASRAGFVFQTINLDRDSEDCRISASGKVAEDSKRTSARLELQVKATAMDKPVGDSFDYPLKMKNYNDLRAERYNPILLVVYAMPPNKADWLLHTEDGLTSRQCAYWCNLRGHPDSVNAAVQRVQIPTCNHLSSESLWKIMHRVSRLEDIGNAI